MIGTIIFRDALEQTAVVKFRNVVGMNELNVFSGTLGNYSDGCDVKRAVQEATIDANPVFSDGPYDAVDQKAVIVYRDLSAGADDTSVFKFELPAPKATIFEDVPEKGKRVTAVVGNAIITALNTATGGNFQFIKGYLKSKE